MYTSTLSLTSSVDGGGWSTPRHGRFLPLNDPVPVYRRLGGTPGQVWTGTKKFRPHRDFFILLYHVLHLNLFLSLDCLVFCLFVFTYNTNIHAPGGIRTRHPSRRAVSDLRSRPRGHRDRHSIPGLTIP